MSDDAPVTLPWIDGTVQDIADRLRTYATPYPAATGMIDGLAGFSSKSPRWRLGRIRMVIEALDQVTLGRPT